MLNYKSRRSRPLAILMIFLSVLFFTVIANCLSIQEVNNNDFLQTESRILLSDLPSAHAQSPSPVQSPTQSPNLTVTSDNKVRLAPKDILVLLIIVLIGALVLLFTLLSPITGLLGFRASEEQLKAKSDFLTAAFPSLLQGVTVILIVMIVTVLTLAGWIESQGTISILSALIGYVLGRKATELEYTRPPSSPFPIRSLAPGTEKLTIEPSQSNQVRFGEKVELKINPPQVVKSIELDPKIGNTVIKSNSVIEYAAPSQADAQNNTSVKITVRSKDNQQAETTLDFVNDTSKSLRYCCV